MLTPDIHAYKTLIRVKAFGLYALRLLWMSIL